MSKYARLKELRNEKGLSIRAFIQEIQMHKTTYVRYEMGTRDLPLSIAIQLADYYGVSLDYLAGRSDKRD